ncbi:MAG TPA: hypothetical protein VLV49_17715 [Terriglobales bacterium]|nr:hypothetical protein [Terriglobales bacterium]
MKQAKTSSAKKRGRNLPARRNGRKALDPSVVRQQIANLVSSKALGMVEMTIAEVEKGHYAAMKYLFEMIGLYPAAGEETPQQGEDSLARTLLRRIGAREDSAKDAEVTKDSAGETAESAGPTVE